jgi:hypothetical protein
MRSVPLHILFSFLFGLVTYPFIGFYSVVVFLSGFVFDVDHYIYYAIRKRDWSLINAYLYCIPGSKVFEPHPDVLHIFHTVEVWLVLFLSGIFFHKIFLFVLLGLIFHMLFDWGSLFLNYEKEKGVRAWSLVKWIYRN